MQNRRPNQLLDIVEAQRFIAALTGNPKSSLVFQTIDDVEIVDAAGVVTRRNRVELRRVLVGTFHQHLAALTRLNNEGAGIFVQVNEGGRGSQHITGIRALFADDDGVGIEPPLEAGIIVQTSADPKNRHFYWPLQPGEDLQRFKPLQRRIAEVLGTDKSVNNLDRVLRLPGSFWNKRGASFRVRLLKADLSLKYTMDEVEAAIEAVAQDDLENYIPISENVKPAPGGGRGRPPLKKLQTKTRIPKKPTGAAVEKETTATAKRLRSWLTARGIRFGENPPENGAIRYVLDRCPLNKEHLEAQIVALPTGAIHAGCFHDSCGGNAQQWPAFRTAIGGWHNDGGFTKGDHVELAERLLQQLRREPSEILCGAADALLRYEPAIGRWCPVPEPEQIAILCAFSGYCVGVQGTLKLKRNDITSTMRLVREQHTDLNFYENTTIGLAFKNGFLKFDTKGKMELTAHSANHHATTGHDFDYDPTATAPRFLQYLEECFEGDTDKRSKIELIQEFAGACLVGVATKFQQALVLIGAGANGKALDLETPIPTPTGWTTQGALEVGDQVLDERGKPCSVIALSEIWQNRPCYRVEFSDGSTVVADANHEWIVRDCRNTKTHTKTTQEIAETLISRVRFKSGQRLVERRWAIPVAQPLDLPIADLPIEPYVLGLWLGNGTSRTAQLTCAKKDTEHYLNEIKKVGYFAKLNKSDKPNASTIHVSTKLEDARRPNEDCLQKRLRACNLLKNKHIPRMYLRASYTQRLALFQGLMDSDGSTLQTQAQCEYTTVNKALAADILELVRSLGLKPTLGEGRATIAGRYISQKYRIIFTTEKGFEPFRLQRKAKICRSRKSKLVRQIVACDPIASVPVRCIQVDSPSHQYLCGESMIPTHNSVLVEILMALVRNHAAVPPHEFSQQYMRARLLGAKLNAAAEIPEGAILDASAFKAIIAGDAVEARLPYGKPFTFSPVAGHVFSANTLPPINDFAAGFWRRLLLIEWNRKFTTEEQDRWLAPTVIQQELPGVCAWALAGAQQLLARGHYTMPESAQTRVTTWKREVNPVALWMHECASLVPPEERRRYTAAGEAYRAFVDWSEANGHKRLSNVAFGRRLKELSVTVRHAETGNQYNLEITHLVYPHLVQ